MVLWHNRDWMIFTKKSHTDLREFRQDKKHRGEQTAICEGDKGKDNIRPMARSILKLLIHSILLEFVSASLAQGAVGWI